MSTAHGQTAYRHAGCRCPICVQAMRDGSRLDRVAAQLRQGGEISYRVDTRRARHRVEKLRADGWNLERIADSADVALATVARVLVASKCSNLTKRAILAVSP